MNDWISKSGHDYCSPSALSLRAACPGSARLLRNAEATQYNTQKLISTTSEFAARGTVLHSLTEGYLKGNVDVTAFKSLPEEDQQQVKWCVNRTKEIIERFKGQNAIVIYEEQIDLTELGISGGKHGSRIDCLILVPGHGAVVIDWKYGRAWVTEPEYNLQTKCYGWGIHHNYGGNVETIILQPQSPEGRDYMSFLITEDHFKEIGKQIKEIVDRAKNPEAPLVRGDHCKDMYCPMFGSCPLWSKSILEIPDEQNVTTYFKTLSPVDRKKFYDHIENIIHVAKHCETAIKKLCVEGGYTIEGYIVTDGRPSYHCDDTDKLIEKLLPYAAEMGLTAEDLLNPPIPAHAKVKSDYIKLLGNKTEIRDILQEIFVKVAGKKILKRLKE